MKCEELVAFGLAEEKTKKKRDSFSRGESHINNTTDDGCWLQRSVLQRVKCEGKEKKGD